MTLRTRLLLIAATLAVVIVGAGTVVWQLNRTAQIHELDERLDLLIPVVTGPQFTVDPPRDSTGDTAGSPAPGDTGQTTTDDTLPTTDAPTDGTTGTSEPANPLSEAYVAELIGDTRQVIAASQRSDSTPAVPDVAAGRDPGDATYATVGSITGTGSWRATIVAARNGTLLLIAIPQSAVDATSRHTLVALGGAGGVVALVLVLAGWWVTRLGLRPISQITAAADQIAAGDREARVDQQDGRTEAARVAKAFNVMLDEHQAAETRLRRFVSDASHELRTPVASIRGFVELYRAGALDDGTQLPDAMRRIGAESVRISRLVDDLLLLARLDERRPIERERVELRQLLDDAALDASATHPSRQVTVSVAGDVIVTGDEARLRQVVANLVTNALVHAPGSTVRLSAANADNGRCVITVADDGPGFAGAEQAFDRFWRGDASRQRASGGSGLGLAIVRAIVTAHGGEVRIDSQPGHGTSAVVLLPLSRTG